ncbi:MAG: hypothetical protein JNL25_02955 [Rhodospirillaceae bacterium]|nr:hypothetical protein [Rhodospirillaceae bacterium]
MSYSSLKLKSRPAVVLDAANSGGWKNGRYRFATPEAEQAWQRAAYRQAVNADTWHLGDEVDDASRDAILAGIAGPTPPMYRGPDGRYRFANAHTIEDAATRSHRARYFAGKTMDQIAGAKMPGEDEYLAAIYGKSQSSVAANDNIMRRADDCAQEHLECDQLCRRAKLSPDMRGIWGGSRDRCMRGCLSAACGGNPVG